MKPFLESQDRWEYSEMLLDDFDEFREKALIFGKIKMDNNTNFHINM
jgi:hypothetical protein